MKIHLVVIDPQNDFSTPQGSLFVQGADQDMSRLALMVKRLGRKLDDIHITMDSHRKVDISHPMWWKDSAGKHPSPFTMITADDVDAGRWTTTQPSAYTRSLKYLRALAAGKRYPHVIWPEHCLTEESKLELFTSQKGSTTIRVVEDKALHGGMRLYKSGGKVVFTTGTKLYSLSLR